MPLSLELRLYSIQTKPATSLLLIEMSSEVTCRKKKSISNSTPAPDGDHRKRRRNRTTQSCLNCHTSKRMCDRKRPACARCTQLGLTGLCVYEVDDPSQRTDTQDESSRLLKRVAELEGVIRELKNKPHPRWTQSTGSGEEFEKWHSRPQGGSDELCPSNAPSPPMSSSSSDKGDSSSNRSSSLHPNAFNSSLHLQLPDSHRMRSPFSPSSPLTGSSPGLMTPTDEYSFSPVGIAGRGSFQDCDLASMFLNYPAIMGVGDNSSFSPVPETRYNKQSGHCGCVQETTNYNNMLELSVRLRKAADVLSRSLSHQLGGFCQLHQRVSELDSFTTNMLSDMSSSPSERVQQSIQTSYHPQLFAQRMTQPRGSMPSGRPWDIMPVNPNSPPSLDDSFMTWEPPRRS